MSTRVVTTPSDITSDATGMERTHTTTQEHTGGETTKDDSVHIISNHVTDDDTLTDSNKTGDPIKAEITFDKDGDTPTDEAISNSNDTISDNTSLKHSDTLPEEVTHADDTTSAKPIVMKTDRGSEGDITDVSNTISEHTTNGSNVANTDSDRGTANQTPQQEQTTEGDIATSFQNDLPHIGPYISDDKDDMESVTTPEVKVAGTTRSVGTSTSSIEEKNRRILESFIKKMKENQHGHRLKLLRPELVKAFIQ